MRRIFYLLVLSIVLFLSLNILDVNTAKATDVCEDSYTYVREDYGTYTKVSVYDTDGTLIRVYTEAE